METRLEGVDAVVAQVDSERYTVDPLSGSSPIPPPSHTQNILYPR